MIVQAQRSIYLTSITNGEVRRAYFRTDFPGKAGRVTLGA